MGSVLRHLKGTVYGYGYHIVNLVNGKIYAGQTVDPVRRWKDHLNAARNGKGGCPYLNNAMSRHGTDAFEFRVVFEASSKEELDEWEKTEIARLDLTNPLVGYNLREGGVGGGKPNLVTRKKMSLSKKALLADPAVVAAWVQKMHTKEVRQRQAEIMAQPEYRARVSANNERTWSEPEARANRVSGITAAHARPDVKERHRRAVKEALSDPDVRRRISNTCRATRATPESKARYREVLARPGYREKLSKAVSAGRRACSANVFVEGSVYSSIAEVVEIVGLEYSTVHERFTKNSTRWRWWFRLPHHRDPECDAVEECWAVMQWAAANQDHPNVPDWLQPARPKHGQAPAWAKRAAA